MPNKIEHIITQIDNNISNLFYFKDTKFWGLSRLEKHQGKTIPVSYEGNSNFKTVGWNDKFGLNIYHRVLSISENKDNALGFGKKALLTSSISMKMVVTGNGKKINNAEVDINYKVSDELVALIPNHLSKTVLTSLDIYALGISTNGREMNKQTVYSTEFPDNEESKIKPSDVVFSIDYQITLKSFDSCQTIACNIDAMEDEVQPFVVVIDGEEEIEVPCGDNYTCVNGSAGNATVRNSDSSYSTSVAGGATLVLPDITLTQPNGDVENHASVKNLVCDTQAVVIENADFDIAANFTALRANADWQSNVLINLNTAEKLIVYNDLDIAYNYPRPTGQTTSYATNDDAWYYTNVWDAVFSATIVGKRPQLTDFSTLLSNNAFGNLDRFTDELGGQTYTNNYIIDHLTGLGWYRVEQAAATWANAITNAESFSTLFSDWFLPNRTQLESIINGESTRPLNYSPFNLQTGAAAVRFLWTSTTISNSTTSAGILIHNNTTATIVGAYSSQTKVTSTNCLSILCRKHY